MGPSEEGYDTDEHHGKDHRVITEYLLLREGCYNLREDTECRKNHDIHFRMTPHPDQVDIHHRIAAQIHREEVCPQEPIQEEQSQSNGQNREREDNHDRAGKYRPGEQRHLHHLHTWCTHLQDGYQEVNPCCQGTDT
ncbi:hypothetical protein D3C86_768870 [compost metagenome]